MSAQSVRMYVPLEQVIASPQSPASSWSSSSSREMVTGRGSRSTSPPRRAISYSFFPRILIAEYMGGSCRISPRKRPRTASI